MKSCTFIGSVATTDCINKDDGASAPQCKLMPHWYTTCSNHCSMLVLLVIILQRNVLQIMTMAKTTKQNEGDNGNVLTTLELNDVANKALSDNPHQAAHDRCVAELQKELVRVGLAEAIEAL